MLIIGLLVLFYLVLPFALTLLAMRRLSDRLAPLAIPIGGLGPLLPMAGLVAAAILRPAPDHFDGGALLLATVVMQAPIEAGFGLVVSGATYVIARRLAHKPEPSPEIVD